MVPCYALYLTQWRVDLHLWWMCCSRMEVVHLQVVRVGGLRMLLARKESADEYLVYVDQEKARSEGVFCHLYGL